jgi:ADP-heptose:LPS heptosyltransferase
VIETVNSILIIKPSSLGDIVHTLPAVAAIRDAHAKAQITWVMNPEFIPLLRGNSDVNHIHVFPRKDFSGLGAPVRFGPWLRETRKLKPDLALDFQGLLRSAFIARMSGAKDVYGMSDAREGSRFFYSKKAKVKKREHAVERYLKLAELAGARIGDALRCPLPTGDPLPRFDEYPPFILLHPFARGNGKSLTNRVIEEICRAFAPTRVVVAGKTNRQVNTAEIAENCVELTNQTSLLQLIRLIRVARFVISVDSGPMHIAAAVNDRLLSIHTWTNPRRVGPYNPDAWVWKDGKIVQVSELENKTLKRYGRPFKIKDIPAIVQLVRPLVPIDPMLA